MSKVKKLVVSFASAYIEKLKSGKVKKDEFLKAHKHLADEDTLKAEYDKIVPPKK